MLFRQPRHIALAALLILATVTAPLTAQELLLQARAAIAATVPGSHAERLAKAAEIDALVRYDVPQAVQKADALVQLAKQHQDAIAEGLAWILKARAVSRTSGREAALAAHASAIETLPANAPLGIAARFTFWKALLWHTLDGAPDFMTDLRRAYDLADRAGDQALMVQIDVVAINELHWSEDPVVETLRICERARETGSAAAILAGNMLLVRARQASGQAGLAVKLMHECEQTAMRLGDRCSQSVMTYYRASMAAHDAVDEAPAIAADNLALCEAIGDQEMLALAHHLIAEIEMVRGDTDAAMLAAQRAIDVFEPLQLGSRLVDLLQTAAQIASARGDVEKAKACGQQILALRRKHNSQANLTDRSRLWQESEQMRKEMRRSKDDYTNRLADMDARINRLLLWGSIGIALLVGTAAGLLLRAKHRLERGNRELQEELALRTRLQQERESLERNLRQLERLDSIGMLAGGFAHDFNNILVSVLGNSQLLLDDERFEGDNREMLEQVLQSAQRAAKLCRDLLHYARETGSARGPADLRDLVTSILPLARVGLGGRIEIHVDLCEAPCPVEIDASQIEQVLMNMLVNARDAMAGTGRIDVQVMLRRLPGRPPTGHWFGEFTGTDRDCIAISIRDHGEGMDEATIRRVFDPFFSTRFAGRGLGLASSFSTLRRHGGVVEIVSARGEGSCFTVYLPRITKLTAPGHGDPIVTLQPAPRRPATTPQPRLLALVVDDEPFVRDVARRALERLDAHVVDAADAERALQLAERHGNALSLALLDVTMPKVDGPELAEQLRQKHQNLPVLFMTGHAQGTRHTGVANSMVVQKPFSPEVLQAAVVQILSRQGATTES